MSTRLRGLTYRDIVKRLKKLGFRFYRQGKGSHELWVRDNDGKVIPLPKHGSKEIRRGTVRAIIRELELTVREFMELD
jgi:predicted RNA binding protein YcfA (HicA-like mRNA interferase family)